VHRFSGISSLTRKEILVTERIVNVCLETAFACPPKSRFEEKMEVLSSLWFSREEDDACSYEDYRGYDEDIHQVSGGA